MREYLFRQFWQSFVDDKCDLENAIQTKAEFSDAIAVMDKIGGWEEGNWARSRFAACMWIYTKAVICNGETTCRIAGSFNSGPSWRPYYTTWQVRALHNGKCCGSLHQRVLTMTC